jgi:hypothetical protein
MGTMGVRDRNGPVVWRRNKTTGRAHAFRPCETWSVCRLVEVDSMRFGNVRALVMRCRYCEKVLARARPDPAVTRVRVQQRKKRQ